MERPSSCTNQFHKEMGVATQDEVDAWTSKSEQELADRLTWLSERDGTQLPLGPYPYYHKRHGWITFSFVAQNWHVCYEARKDFKLGLKFVKTPCVGIDGRGIPTPFKSVEVRLMQEQFDAENNCFTKGNTWPSRLSGK